MRFGTPYASGGLRDQPIRKFQRIKVALNIYDAMTQWKYKPESNNTQQEAYWYKTHDHVVKILELVEELRVKQSE